jgi:hypothetical protein
MGEIAERFRARARECRLLAEGARDEYARGTLTQVADELEEEAKLIEAEEEQGKGA